MKWALLFVAYVLTAKLGLLFEPVGGFATLVWPPTGIALVGAIALGPRAAFVILPAAFLVNVTSGAPLLAATGIALGNSAEALIGAALLKRVGFDTSLARPRDVIALLSLAGLGSTVVSALVGTASLRLTGVIDDAMLNHTFFAWWIGDALGAIVTAPLLWSCSREPQWRRIPEAIAVFSSLAALAAVVFVREAPTAPGAIAYLVFPSLILAALRFGQPGATIGAAALSLIAVSATAYGLGPFGSAGEVARRLALLQLYLGVSSATAMLLAAAITETREAHAARERFLSVAAHELRTPLTSLTLQVAQLERRTPSESVSALRRQTDRLIRLTENLLDTSRMMAGRFDILRERCDLAAVVSDVATRFTDQLARAGCALELETTPCEGHWDRMRVEQVLVNLLQNAAKHGSGKPIRVTLGKEAATAILRVRDHGHGIAAADHARIFEPFERVERRDRTPGLGLGLWIVNQIVSAMGGDIRVESKLGEGATFVVTLPVA